MAKRSSNLKEKVHSLCENIYAIKNLTVKSIASFDYCDRSNEISQYWTKVRYFVALKLEQAKIFREILRQFLITFYSAILDLLKILLFKKMTNQLKYSKENVGLREQ